MPIFRALLLVFAIAVALCVAALMVTGNRKYLGWSCLLFRLGIATALLFFAVLLLERIA